MAGIQKYAPFLYKNESLNDAILYHKISQNINRIRVDKGISIRILALMTGISEKTLYRIESGTQKVSIAIAYKISVAMKISMNEILDVDIARKINDE